MLGQTLAAPARKLRPTAVGFEYSLPKAYNLIIIFPAPLARYGARYPHLILIVENTPIHIFTVFHFCTGYGLKVIIHHFQEARSV